MTLTQATQVALLSNASVTLVLASPAISRILGHALRTAGRLLRRRGGNAVKAGKTIKAARAGKARPEALPLDSAGG